MARSNDPGRPGPALSVTRRTVSGIEVAELRGELDLGTAHMLGAIVHAGDAALVLDVSGLDFLDVTGARALLEARMEARRARQGFALVCPQSAPAFRILRLTGMIGRGRVYRQVDDAVAELAGG
jgi:anti-anti-sigma factor